MAVPVARQLSRCRRPRCAGRHSAVRTERQSAGRRPRKSAPQPPPVPVREPTATSRPAPSLNVARTKHPERLLHPQHSPPVPVRPRSDSDHDGVRCPGPAGPVAHRRRTNILHRGRPFDPRRLGTSRAFAQRLRRDDERHLPKPSWLGRPPFPDGGDSPRRRAGIGVLVLAPLRPRAPARPCLQPAQGPSGTARAAQDDAVPRCLSARRGEAGRRPHRRDGAGLCPARRARRRRWSSRISDGRADEACAGVDCRWRGCLSTRSSMAVSCRAYFPAVGGRPGRRHQLTLWLDVPSSRFS